ncbi:MULTISPECIES: hypothetical protein [Flavobacterium]|uniref:Uncharacterized protein n=1 Tax=Flavobacterium hankyongi TaxID=1176532 RepID=A0ABP9A026_9FLAO|nr:hypothetical protein [Flavobacterium sp. N1846]
MTQVLAIMIIFFVFLSIYFMIKIKNVAVRLTKSKELNNEENKFEKKYQFIRGLY